MSSPQRTATGSQARQPDDQGIVVRDGVGTHWESYGAVDRPAVLLLPTWSIVHSRLWKFQIPYLARRFRVVVFDGRGSGLSDRPREPHAYADREYALDALAVLDAARVATAVVVGLSCGARYALLMNADAPERLGGLVLIAPGVPFLTPPLPERAVYPYADDLGFDEGWARYNRHSWRRDQRGFLEFFFAECFPERHSSKQIEDCVAWGLDTGVETLLAIEDAELAAANETEAAELCRRVTSPALVIHGTDDRITPVARGERVAELVGGELVLMEDAGHIPIARDPVFVNRQLNDFCERVYGRPPRATGWQRASRPERRALFVSSPIGLGHAWRDVAIADELRRQVPGLRIDWLAQEPVTRVLLERGEGIHPASADLASEAAHIDREAGDHELNAFAAIRRMDEVLCANFGVFADVVAHDRYDVWIGDEAWEVDHFLHENPELKTAPYAWLTDFVGFLPMPAGGSREAELTADLNAEMLEHIARHPRLRDRSIFLGEPADVTDGSFGPGLPSIRAWTEAHYAFCGYVAPEQPAALADRSATRAALGWGDEPVCLVSVGGSGAGGALLRRAVAALAPARERVPGLRMVAVAGPRIDPASLPSADGLETLGYVHELWRLSAACDVALVQGGLATTMELVAAARPFVAVPLANHFEQRYHVRHRLDRHGARDWLELADSTPEALASAIAKALASPPAYEPVARGAASRAAGLIAELLR